MARVLLLLPTATYRARDFLEAARALQVQVVVGSDAAQALGEVMGTRALALPLGDVEAAAAAIVEHDRVAPLDAVVAVDDQGSEAASRACERLGLLHNPRLAVRAARDKLLMREMLAEHEVRQPAFAALKDASSDEEVREVTSRVGFPCVIKPTTLAASQGVLRADDPLGARDTARRVRRIATAAGVGHDQPLLVERFVDGPEVAVEGLLDSGSLEVLAIFDKPDPMDGPAFEETIYVTPSRLSRAEQDEVVDATRDAASALGLVRGPVHAELRLGGHRASVIEVAARTIGGLCSRCLSFSTGRTLEELVLAQAVGVPLEDVRRDGGASGVLMLPIPRAGTFSGVDGSENALRVPGVTGIEITVAPGRHIEPVPEGNRYLGFVFARAARPEDAELALRKAWGALDVRIEPD